MSNRSNSFFRLWPAAAVCLLTAACGGGGDSDTGGISETPDASTETNNVVGESNLVPLDAPATWSLGPATYVVPGANSTSQINIAGRVIVSASTNDEDTGNAEYSGSQLTLQLSQGGTGDYTVVDNINLDPGGSRVAFVSVRAGTEVDGLARSSYVSTTGLISIQVDADGGYHASTIEPLTLTRDSDIGTGVPNSPDQISFTMRNIFGQRN